MNTKDTQRNKEVLGDDVREVRLGVVMVINMIGQARGAAPTISMRV